MDTRTLTTLAQTILDLTTAMKDGDIRGSDLEDTKTALIKVYTEALKDAAHEKDELLRNIESRDWVYDRLPNDGQFVTIVTDTLETVTGVWGTPALYDVGVICWVQLPPIESHIWQKVSTTDYEGVGHHVTRLGLPPKDAFDWAADHAESITFLRNSKSIIKGLGS